MCLGTAVSEALLTRVGFPLVISYKDLGFLIDKNFEFDDHVNFIIKIFSTLFDLYFLLFKTSNLLLFRKFFLTYILPKHTWL